MYSEWSDHFPQWHRQTIPQRLLEDCEGYLQAVVQSVRTHVLSSFGWHYKVRRGGSPEHELQALHVLCVWIWLGAARGALSIERSHYYTTWKELWKPHPPTKMRLILQFSSIFSLPHSYLYRVNCRFASKPLATIIDVCFIYWLKRNQRFKFRSIFGQRYFEYLRWQILCKVFVKSRRQK